MRFCMPERGYQPGITPKERKTSTQGCHASVAPLCFFTGYDLPMICEAWSFTFISLGPIIRSITPSSFMMKVVRRVPI